ncbi:hypothetical protein BCR43DRAFT_496545 [Syncephalastrum racemosum]|uniref:F-box domain-containing protein n=1 Tax=Syncephalastrum racemosum TaxID=13706 RepID=A0A1X2H499_SYNRA|nr:hypothetical protein BCR43DRAFT_496545 [Syncephalastrum racemosum]
MARRGKDPFELLTHEILKMILDLIPEQRVTCMLVSRAWRDLVRKTPPAHLTVALRERQLNQVMRRGLDRELQLNPPSLKWLSSKSNMCSLASELVRTKCFKLKKLSVEDNKPLANEAPLDDFIRNCTRLTENLTHLEVLTGYKGTKSLFEFITSHCPQLVNLSYRHVSNTTPPDLPRGSTKPTQLRQLFWQGDVQPFSNYEYLSKYCPNLEVLQLLRSPRAALLRLNRYLQTLQKLPKLVDWRLVSDSEHRLPVPNLDAGLSKPGLRNLIIEGRFKVDIKIVLDIVLKNHDTLVHFDYEPFEYDFESSDFRAFSNGRIDRLIPKTAATPFPSLRHLHIDFMLRLPLSALLSDCPVLETLEFTSVPMKPEIIDRLNLRTLRRFIVRDCLDGAEVFTKLVDAIAALGSDANLRSLEFTDKDFGDRMPIERLLPILGSMSSLEELRLDAYFNTALKSAPAYLREFARKAIRSRTNLRELSLGQTVVSHNKEDTVRILRKLASASST